MTRSDTPLVSDVTLSFYTVPTTLQGEPQPESDGTAHWDSTGVLVAHVAAGGVQGLGYAYTARAALTVAKDVLAPLVIGSDPMDRAAVFWSIVAAVRNVGWPGVAASAISALDIALADLAGKLSGVALVQLLGGARTQVAGYGSGGFTSYTDQQLRTQLSGWADEGFRSVKIKVGTHPERDVERVRAARDAIGDDVELFVDANGAYDRSQALRFAQEFAQSRVTWFEEPVSSDDLHGLRLLRDRAPAGMRIAAGEYGYTPSYFRTMLEAGAVDTLQADSTRCGGATGFLVAAALASAAQIPFSAHTAPALHGTLASSIPNAVNVEYFQDHVLIEERFFDGLPQLLNGNLIPDRSRPGHGLEPKRAEAAPFLVEEWSS